MAQGHTAWEECVPRPPLMSLRFPPPFFLEDGRMTLVKARVNIKPKAGGFGESLLLSIGPQLPLQSGSWSRGRSGGHLFLMEHKF